MQEAREVALAEGETKGKLEAKLEIARNAKAAGLTIKQIEAITGLSLAQLEQHGI